MKIQAIERVLKVIIQEMGCKDAHLRLGGDPPQTDCIVSVPAPGGVYLVVEFDTPPDDRSQCTTRLKQLGKTFFDAGLSLPAPSPDAEAHLARRRLDDELAALAGRTGATGANVIDLKSPVIWGCSESRHSGEDLESFLRVAEVLEQTQALGIDLAVISGLGEDDRASALEELQGELKSRARRLIAQLSGRPLRSRKDYLLHARVLREVRNWTEGLDDAETSVRRLTHLSGLGYFARSFAGIYMLVLYFPGPFSELHVEGTALHYLPVIERHVLGLPPVDPTPPGGKVLKMPMSQR